MSNKQYGILYYATVDTPPTPDAGYMKLYPKTDGWYALNSDGVEIRLGAVIIMGEDEVPMQGSTLQFDSGFTLQQDGDKIIISISWAGLDMDTDGEGLPVHGNEAHYPDFATEQDLLDHIFDIAPHGIDLGMLHEQDTDEYLDYGGDNQVSAAEIRAMLDAGISEASLRTVQVVADTEYTLPVSVRAVMANTISNNVDIVLPETVGDGVPFTFRKIHDANAMTVTRSGTDTISWNGQSWIGITTDDLGTWFTLVKTDGVWYVIEDSGLTALNEES